MKNKISEAIARVEEKYLKEYVADEQEMRDLFKIDMKNTWFTWWIDVFKQELLKAYKAGDEAHTATLLQRVEELDVYWTRDACVKKSEVLDIIKKDK